MPNNDEIEVQNQNNEDDKIDATAALELKKEICRKLMDIYSDSTFSNVNMFEDKEENNMENEAEDDLLCEESITVQSSSNKADYSHDPPKGFLSCDYLNNVKKLVISPESDYIMQGKKWITLSMNPLGGSYMSSEVSTWLLSDVLGHMFLPFLQHGTSCGLSLKNYKCVH